MKYIHIITIACSLLITSHQVAAKVYKWVDEKGQTHYSERAPANQATEVIKPKTGYSDPVNYSSAAASSTAANANATNNEAAGYVKDPERCAAAQKNQTTLQTSSRVQVRGDNGEYRYLTPDELQQKMDEASKAIEESCE